MHVFAGCMGSCGREAPRRALLKVTKRAGELHALSPSVSSHHPDDRPWPPVRPRAPRKLAPRDGRARETLRAVGRLVVAARACRQNEDRDGGCNEIMLFKASAGAKIAQPCIVK